MKNILIVDDHADIRKWVRVALALGDDEIHAAVDGEMGLLAARQLRPDGVLLDGLMVCSRRKAEGLRAGADVYLAKPVSPPQLAHSVAALWMTH